MIALSAGHYPEAPGACWENTCEHEIASFWVERIGEYLATPHFIVQTGRLPVKVSEISRRAATLAVELHFNAAGGHGEGCETLYCPGSVRGRQFAEAVHSYYSHLFPPNRGVKEGWYRMDRPGVKDYPEDVEGDEKPDYFLRKTLCPAIILEPEFIHRIDLIEVGMDKACEAISRGLDAAHQKLFGNA